MVLDTMCSGTDSVLRERLPQLWRSIEDAHYSYLQIDDSPEKLQQRKKLEGYIREYLSLVPHECKFGLSETGKVFQRTVSELHDFSAYRAGLGWAALARYAANLLAQPWRKEYTTIRLYCGYYKHEVEANLVGAEVLLDVMGYRPDGAGRVSLDGPICPDLVAAVSRDALIAYVECQMMALVWERAWRGAGKASWAEVALERARCAGDVSATIAGLENAAHSKDADIYSNVKSSTNTDLYRNKPVDSFGDYKKSNYLPPSDMSPPEDTMFPLVQPSPYVTVPSNHMPSNPNHMPHNLIYSMGPQDPRYAEFSTQCNPMMNPYGVMPGFYYAPVQTPYMYPSAMYAPIKHASTVPVNGYQMHRYPSVPIGQLIELDPPPAASGYLSSDVPDGKYYKKDDDRHKRPHRNPESSRRRDKSVSDGSLLSIPRSDTQPVLSKAKEDGMGTYESWDYVFRNLSNHNDKERNRSSPPLERDSRTLERLERDERRRFQPTTMDLEDGLQALSLDRSYDEEIYRTAKVNENLMKLKQENELKKAKSFAKKQLAEEKERRKRIPESSPDPEIINTKIAQDKIRLISRKDSKDRKEIQKQTLSNGSINGSSVESKRVKKVVKINSEPEKHMKVKPSLENGMQSMVYGGKTTSASSSNNHSAHGQHNGLRDLNTHLIVTLDETDSLKNSQQNGLQEHSATVHEPPRPKTNGILHDRTSETNEKKWECGTCTYINNPSLSACEMCGKSRKRGPEVMPLTSGGRECPACTLVNKRDASTCEACATSLKHSPTYI